MAKDPKKFVMVRSCSPRGQFRRAGLIFQAAWRALELAEKADIEKGVIDAAILKQLEAEKTMLAVKPATAEDVAAFLKAQAEMSGKDDKTIIDELRAKNADLEARLMKLELAASGDKK